ncbi:hypothetical protein FRB95_012899 [Tulasnella sp. JGI-2019a]|nr:hypothetical protein FRB95_012899 [Tulasnella sp. JGI-2019a]
MPQLCLGSGYTPSPHVHEYEGTYSFMHLRGGERVLGYQESSDRDSLAGETTQCVKVGLKPWEAGFIPPWNSPSLPCGDVVGPVFTANTPSTASNTVRPRSYATSEDSVGSLWTGSEDGYSEGSRHSICTSSTERAYDHRIHDSPKQMKTALGPSSSWASTVPENDEDLEDFSYFGGGRTHASSLSHSNRRIHQEAASTPYQKARSSYRLETLRTGATVSEHATQTTWGNEEREVVKATIWSYAQNNPDILNGTANGSIRDHRRHWDAVHELLMRRPGWARSKQSLETWLRRGPQQCKNWDELQRQVITRGTE